MLQKSNSHARNKLKEKVVNKAEKPQQGANQHM
jgi:hypothetical protein